MAYLLDANVFISAHRLHYSFDVCPGFWAWLDLAFQAGSVCSIDAIAEELLGHDDQLADWVRLRRSMFAEPAEPTVADIDAISQVNRWANESTHYTDAAKAQFALAADSFVVGQALAGNHTVVTHERPSNSKHRIKIPNAAAQFQLRVRSPFVMLRSERARFELARPNEQQQMPLPLIDPARSAAVGRNEAD
ncbi:DUF4411 family protein [Candidatus Poriferisodalis sp.]|uniref:DUF4411 family protein n=1 Tax=Candidatus Poriferisodalis sp. TaxID=3101277 RepID=UPI003B0176D9